jgi:uncharacterized protein (TIGR03437 family)
MLFVTNVDLGASSAVSVSAVNSLGATFPLPVEYVGKVPGMDIVTSLVVRLPQDSALRGDVSVSVTVAGMKSNSVVFAIR